MKEEKLSWRWIPFFGGLGLLLLLLGHYIMTYGSVNIPIYYFGIVIGMCSMGYFMFALSALLKIKKRGWFG